MPLLLASQVARTYFQMLRLNEQALVARRTLAQREETLKLVQDRVNAGLDTRLELRQSEGGLPEARLQLETVQEQLKKIRDTDPSPRVRAEGIELLNKPEATTRSG